MLNFIHPPPFTSNQSTPFPNNTPTIVFMFIRKLRLVLFSICFIINLTEADKVCNLSWTSKHFFQIAKLSAE